MSGNQGGGKGPGARPPARGEPQLVSSLRERDAEAFRELYRDYHRPLSRFLLNMMHRPHLVEEVLDDTMLVVWNRIDAFQGNSRLSTWIYGIAYRQALSALRRHDEPVEQDADRPSEQSAASPEWGAWREQARSKLDAAIGKLSPVHRAVINLTYFDEMCYREIAEIMDCPEATVKTRMFHARLRLRQLLAGEFSDWT